MGYDLYWVNEPENVITLRKAAKGREAWDTYFDAQRAAGCYFRANIFGMNFLRNKMDEAGMLFDVPQERRMTWPTVPSEDEETYDEEWNRTSPAGIAYNQACRKVQEESFECPGIPWHKLCDNSGWVVTPREIQSALKLYAKSTAEKPLEFESADDGNWFQQWLLWMGTAAQHGGFEVH